jgi:hypothetical protein
MKHRFATDVSTRVVLDRDLRPEIMESVASIQGKPAGEQPPETVGE